MEQVIEFEYQSKPKKYILIILAVILSVAIWFYEGDFLDQIKVLYNTSMVSIIYWGVLLTVLAVITGGSMMLLRSSRFIKKGRCWQDNDSVYLTLSGCAEPFNLDSITQIALQDNRKKWQCDDYLIRLLIYNRFHWFPGWDDCLSLVVNTGTKEIKITGTPIKQDSGLRDSQLYQIAMLVKKTYDMKPKLDENKIPILNAYVARR